MKIKAVVMALVLAVSPIMAEARSRTDEAMLQARAFILACAWSRYDCSYTTRPYVIYDESAGEMDAYGYYYMGDDTIYLDDDLINDPYRLVVLVHEMTHYLQSKSGEYGWPYTKAQSCAQEKEAFTVARNVAQAVFGRDYDKAPAWEEMIEYYDGCKEVADGEHSSEDSRGSDSPRDGLLVGAAETPFGREDQEGRA